MPKPKNKLLPPQTICTKLIKVLGLSGKPQMEELLHQNVFSPLALHALGQAKPSKMANMICPPIIQSSEIGFRCPADSPIASNKNTGIKVWIEFPNPSLDSEHKELPTSLKKMIEDYNKQNEKGSNDESKDKSNNTQNEINDEENDDEENDIDIMDKDDTNNDNDGINKNNNEISKKKGSDKEENNESESDHDVAIAAKQREAGKEAKKKKIGKSLTMASKSNTNTNSNSGSIPPGEENKTNATDNANNNDTKGTDNTGENGGGMMNNKIISARDDDDSDDDINEEDDDQQIKEIGNEEDEDDDFTFGMFDDNKPIVDNNEDHIMNEEDDDLAATISGNNNHVSGVDEEDKGHLVWQGKVCHKAPTEGNENCNQKMFGIQLYQIGGDIIHRLPGYHSPNEMYRFSNSNNNEDVLNLSGSTESKKGAEFLLKQKDSPSVKLIFFRINITKESQEAQRFIKYLISRDSCAGGKIGDPSQSTEFKLLIAPTTTDTNHYLNRKWIKENFNAEISNTKLWAALSIPVYIFPKLITVVPISNNNRKRRTVPYSPPNPSSPRQRKKQKQNSNTMAIMNETENHLRDIMMGDASVGHPPKNNNSEATLIAPASTTTSGLPGPRRPSPPSQPMAPSTDNYATLVGSRVLQFDNSSSTYSLTHPNPSTPPPASSMPSMSDTQHALMVQQQFNDGTNDSQEATEEDIRIQSIGAFGNNQ